MFGGSHLVSLIQYLSTTLVHPLLFPYPWISTLHAARITHAYRCRIKASGNRGRLRAGPEYAGFLLMCWGGTLITNFLMFLPPPQLLSISPWVNYLGVYILFGYTADMAPSLKTVDTALPLLDAILRSGSVCGAVNLAYTHPNPAIASSLFFQLFVGALASGGAGITTSTLGVWNSEWSFRTPPFLYGGMVDTLDIWGGSLTAAVYGCLMGYHPAYEPYTRWLSGMGTKYVPGTPLVSPLEARSVVIVVLAVLFSFRVYKVHYAAFGVTKIPSPQPTKEKSE